jgi:Spy/CpxP family protein refolding chaperone
MWKKIGMVSGALLLLGVGLVTLTAFSGGGWCHGHRGPRDPAQVAAMVTNHVEDALDDLNATPDQRTRILAVKDRMLAEAQQVHGDQKATHQALLEAWKSDAPDAAKLHALVDQRVEEMRKLAHEAVDAGIEVHGILTPDQRAKLTKKIERWHR